MHRAVKGQERNARILVPTLRVGMDSGTLRVLRRGTRLTRGVAGGMPTQGVGNERMLHTSAAARVLFLTLNSRLFRAGTEPRLVRSLGIGQDARSLMAMTVVS
jgi:hypothetical protein